MSDVPTNESCQRMSFISNDILFLAIILCTLSIIAVIIITRRYDGKQAGEDCSAQTTSTEEQATQSIAKDVQTVKKPGFSQYRIDSELRRGKSAAFTQRGSLWSRRASWHLPSAPRILSSQLKGRYLTPGLHHMREICAGFEIDMKNGFLPAEDPLQRLPYSRYHIWEDLADDLPKLLGARLGQVRTPLEQLPVLSTDKLITSAELKRAHLLLCLFAHSYIWGGPTPMDAIPEGIAIPLWEISKRLDIPPVLGHASIVMYNWRRLDTEADICMENLSTLNNFFDGRDESWFYLITVEVEAKGAGTILPLMLTMDAISRYNEEVKEMESLRDIKRILEKRKLLTHGALESIVKEKSSATHSVCNASKSLKAIEIDNGALDDSTNRYYHPRHASSDDLQVYSYMYEEDMPHEEPLMGDLDVLRVIQYVTMQLSIVAAAIKDMDVSLNSMNEGCLPFIFYHRVRPFLSGWKDNPTLPNGVLYSGVNKLRQQFYGGSAAQSPITPFLDIGLGIEHKSTASHEFLSAMRAYMLRPHREFLEYWEKVSCLKRFIDEVMDLTGFTTENIADEMGSTARRGDIDDAIDAVRELVKTYNACLLNLTSFRTSHISLVGRYILQQQEKRANEWENTAGGKGTGGTDLMNFLKPIRNDCKKKVVTKISHEIQSNEFKNSDETTEKQADMKTDGGTEHLSNAVNSSVSWVEVISPVSPHTDIPHYLKYEGQFEDIDLYRGASRPAKEEVNTAGVVAS